MLLWNLVIISSWRSMTWGLFLRSKRILQDPFALSCTIERKDWLQTHLISIIFFCSSHMWRLKYIKSNDPGTGSWFLLHKITIFNNIDRAYWVHTSLSNREGSLAQCFRQLAKGLLHGTESSLFNKKSIQFAPSMYNICMKDIECVLISDFSSWSLKNEWEE